MAITAAKMGDPFGYFEENFTPEQRHHLILFIRYISTARGQAEIDKRKLQLTAMHEDKINAAQVTQAKIRLKYKTRQWLLKLKTNQMAATLIS